MKSSEKFRIVVIAFTYAAALICSSEQLVAAEVNVKDLSRVPVAQRLNHLNSTYRFASEQTTKNLSSRRTNLGLALNEAKFRISKLKNSESARQCSNGIERNNSCLEFYGLADAVLQSSFQKFHIADSLDDFKKTNDIVWASVRETGAFTELPRTGTRNGMTILWIDQEMLLAALTAQSRLRVLKLESEAEVSKYNSAVISYEVLLVPIEQLRAKPAGEMSQIVDTIIAAIERIETTAN